MCPFSFPLTTFSTAFVFHSGLRADADYKFFLNPKQNPIMKQIVGIILIIAAIALGIDGMQKFDNSSTSVKFLGITINAENEGGKETAVLELVLAVAALAGGIFLIGNSKGR